MRHLFGTLAKDWFARLTQPQREAWNLYARRIHRRWRPGRRPLTGQQAYLKLNSVLGRIGRPPLLWPPPQPAPFRPNPVQAARLRWDAGRLRLELLVAPRPKGDFLLFASAPCSPGWSRMRRPVYLGLLPAPADGISDITALYLARFPAPRPDEQVFIQTRQHRHGWEGPSATHSALVPPTPAPQPPPNLNPNLNLARRRASHCAPRSPHSALRTLPLHSPPSPRPHTACTREIPILPAPTAPSRTVEKWGWGEKGRLGRSRREIPPDQTPLGRSARMCPCGPGAARAPGAVCGVAGKRRKCHWRDLWRGT